MYFAFCLHKDHKFLWDNLHIYDRQVDSNLPKFTYADNLIVSCLLHDFMRFVDGVNDSNHDQRLIEITDLLLPETYTHSNPPNEELILIQADRLELLRYKDKDWINESLIKKNLYGGEECLSHFFQHIRPVLEKMFIGRCDIWFSHALEIRKHPIWNAVNKEKLPVNLENNLGVNFYPKIHWIAEDFGYKHNMKEEYEKYFSVHTGKLPFKNCIAFTKDYYHTQAIISKETIKKYGCNVKSAPPSTAGRDHLFIVQNQKIPTSEWIFLYDFDNNTANQFDQIELDDLRTIKAKLFNDIYRATNVFLNHFESLCID